MIIVVLIAELMGFITIITSMKNRVAHAIDKCVATVWKKMIFVQHVVNEKHCP